MATFRLATCSSLHLMNKLNALGQVYAADWAALLPRQPFFSLLYDSERVHNPLMLLWAGTRENFLSFFLKKFSVNMMGLGSLTDTLTILFIQIVYFPNV